MYSVEIIHCCVCVWNPWHGGIRIHSVQASLDTCKWIGFRDQRDDCKGHVRDRFVCDEDVNIYFKMHMHNHTQLIHHYKYIPKYTHTHIWHNYQSIINTCKNLPTHTHWRKYYEHLLLYTYVHVQMPPHNHHNRYVWKYTHTHIFGNTHTHTHWHNSTSTSTSAEIYIHITTCMCVYIYRHIQMYIDTITHVSTWKYTELIYHTSYTS